VDTLRSDQRWMKLTNHGGSVHFPIAEFVGILDDLSLGSKRRIFVVTV
jgi:hypothetical protein